MKNNRFNEMEEILSLWLKGKIIDKKEGANGVVFVVDNGEGVIPRYVAYKTIKAFDKIEEDKLKNFVREAKQWFKVKGHELILTPFYITQFKNLPLICMPYCEMDLQTYLEKHGKLETVEALVFVAQILKGLIFAKNRGIEAHQDLKPKNILLEDLSKKFAGFPPRDVYMPIRYRVRVADFGLANAWKELGKPHGTKPYMAPEQYEGGDNFSKVDVFAIGVILHELIMGRHPIGKKTSDLWPQPKEGYPKKYKHDKPWKKWARSREKIIKIGHDKVSKKLEELTESMLLPDLKDRPSLEYAFENVMNLLFEVHKPTAEQLKLLFEYYDNLAGYLEDENRLHNLVQLSELPGQLDTIINDLLEEISRIEKEIDNPRQAVYFCEVCYSLSTLLLRQGKYMNKEKVRNFAERIVSEAVKWRDKIKTHHKYPEIKFKDRTLFKTPPLRDFEVYAGMIGYGRALLNNVITRSEIDTFFENKDNYAKSAYFYNIACELHTRNNRNAIKMLDRCIELNPKEALFYYMKALWTEHLLLLEQALVKLKPEEEEDLKLSVIENCQKALQFDPNWEGPKKLLKSLQKSI